MGAQLSRRRLVHEEGKPVNRAQYSPCRRLLCSFARGREVLSKKCAQQAANVGFATLANCSELWFCAVISREVLQVSPQLG